MGCDATFSDQLAETPHPCADLDAQYACPKPEHTGMGFPDDGAWEPDAASLCAMPLHPQAGGFLFYPARPPDAAWSGCRGEAMDGIGGGSYSRLLSQNPQARLYRVRKLCSSGEFATVTQALTQWNADKQSISGARAAVIEIADSATYHEAPAFHLDPGDYLQLRASNQSSPVLRMFDYHSGAPEQVSIRGGAGSRFTLDGVLVAGGGLDITDSPGAPEGLPFQVAVRHCTLVPGWDPDYTGRAPWSARASITVSAATLALRIDRCILGPVRVAAGPTGKPVAFDIADSMLDSGHDAGLALSDCAFGAAFVNARIRRCTVAGVLQLHRLELAENSLFLGVLLAAQRIDGAMRHCYVTPGSRTPRRLHCQPELAQYAPGVNAEREAARVRPRFASLRYGTPGYGQLAPDCAEEITSGADDATGLGAGLISQPGLPPDPFAGRPHARPRPTAGSGHR